MYTKMLQCNSCFYRLDHPFGLNISGGECSGCLNHREKDVIDWSEKSFQLETLLKRFHKKSKAYDCVVPVVGDAEDFFTVSKVLELGLSPLIVGVNDYFKNNIGWQNTHQLITFFDVDSLFFNPDVRTYKELVRTSLRKFDHILLPFIQLHTSFPVHIALERKIPLVIWGQNQPVEQVGKFSHHDAVQMSRWSRKAHDLFGNEINDLIGNGAQVQDRELNYYQYPDTKKLSRRGITGIYLSNYMRWDSLSQNESTIKFGFQPETNFASFDIYERAGSSVYYTIHDLLKLKRRGYRKITDHLVREIRHKRIDREAAQKVLSAYDAKKVDIKPFFDWLDVSSSGYEWFVRHKLNGFEHLIGDPTLTNDDVEIPASIKNFLLMEKKPDQNFILFGKGIAI
jgi:N-acetyl sugar amidotransferase